MLINNEYNSVHIETSNYVLCQVSYYISLLNHRYYVRYSYRLYLASIPHNPINKLKILDFVCAGLFGID